VDKMSQQSSAIINHNMLKLAREQSGYSIEEAAVSGISSDKLAKAERGEDYLTFKQFLILANKYKRPPAFFYLKEIPKEKLINDFRTLESKKIKYSPLLRDSIIITRNKRELAVKFQEYDKKYDYDFIKSITEKDNIDEVAKKILNLLNLDISLRKKWRTKYDALNGWKKAIEELGVLIFQISYISVDEMRGFSFSDIPYPTIILNRSDSPFGRIFTLLHEFCHLMLKKGGLCTYGEKDELHNSIERFCNAVAGEVLVPENELRELSLVGNHSSTDDWESSELNSLQKKFWVSHEVILRRLLYIKKTTKEYYKQKRDEWNSFQPIVKEDIREKKFQVVLRTHSKNYIKIVLDSMNNNNITLHDVSYYLNMNLKHLENLEKNL